MSQPTIMTLFDAPPPRRLHPVRAGLMLTLVGAILWSGSAACLWTNESTLVFQARRSRFRSLGSTAGVIQLRTEDGINLDALRFSTDDPSAYWILFCPPSGATIHGGIRRHLKSLHAAGYQVLAFDYRGFGRNSGVPSEAGVYADGLAAYRYLTREIGVPPQRIILAGRSLGSAVAVEIATRVPAGGLLLFSAIDSVPDAASRLYFWVPVGMLASQRFDSLAKAPRVTVPVLQVHSSKDWLVPLDAARAMFEKFPGRKAMLELPGRHNDVGIGGEALDRALAEFWPNPQAGNRPITPGHPTPSAGSRFPRP